MITYLGYNVLEDEPRQGGPRPDDVQQRFELLDDGGGARALSVFEDYPDLVRPLRWHLHGEGEIAAFRAFVDGQKGRLIPFWIPAYEYDFTVLDPITTFVNTIRVNDVGYASHVFPLGPTRRHLYFSNRATISNFIRKAVAAVPNGDGSETITLDSNPSAGIATSVALVTYLRLVRLADDVLKIHWRSGGSTAYAFVDMDLAEVPMEVPA